MIFVGKEAILSQIIQYLIVLRETHPTMFVIIVSLFEIVVIHELMQLWKQRSACAAAIRRFLSGRFGCSGRRT